MFILEILLGLKSKQGNVLYGFLHGELEPGENVYVEMPLGFSQHYKDGTRKVLKLKKTLYGLCQSPQAFLKYKSGIVLSDLGGRGTPRMFDPVH
jgi:hypothetical protein